MGAHAHVTQHMYKDTRMSLWVVVCCCPGLLKNALALGMYTQSCEPTPCEAITLLFH